MELYTGRGAYRNDLGIWQTDNLMLKEEPDVDLRGITRTHGLVYHTPLEWLSLIYNRSSNFEPGNGTKNIFGEVIAMREGEGEEWGIQLQTKDRKYTARINHFENSSNNAQVADWYIVSLRQNFIGYMEHEIRNTLRDEHKAGLLDGSITEPNRDAWVEAHPDYLPFGGRRWDSEVVATRDFSSEGWELELRARPIKGLDLRLTVAHTESINSDILTHMQRWLSQTGGTDVNRWSADETRLQVWERYYNRSRSNRTQTVENWEGDTGTVGGKLFADNNRFPRYYEIISGIGFPNQMNRQWRANFTANYRFRDGALKGLSTGFGARWRERAAIGYFPKPNEFIDDPEATLPDITKPVYGKDQFFLDIWFKYQKKIRIAGHPVNWVLHFRVKNPFESSPRVVPQEASYAVDGSVTDWEVEASRTFQLSNSFKF